MLDPGFVPLDNSTNERPDWREFWPIRNFLMREKLDESRYYGFLAPNFFRRIGLRASDVHADISQAGLGFDVVSFSPYPDFASMFVNVFAQNVATIPDMPDIAAAFARIAELPRDPRAIVNTACDTIFCNYFAAKPAYWRVWLSINERLFAIAESRQGDLAERLNATSGYLGAPVPNKVFLMERISSYILAVDPRWKVWADPFNKQLRFPDVWGKHLPALRDLDAHKIAYRETGAVENLKAYYELSARLRETVHGSMPA